ncbi:MAG: MATE family efflux transporter [Oscillibacter sp.]|jgi:putative MATE family efflux protein|nr:MATE family efflux transporter [Oscillibacter sp.]
MEHGENRYDLTEGAIWKKLLLFFWPIAVGTLFQQLYNTVDAVVVGKFVGTQALAAVGGSAAQVVSLFIGFFVALTGGAGAVIAQLFGASRRTAISQAAHSAVTFSVLIGIAVTAVGIPLTPVMLHWMGTPADTMADSVIYLRIYFAGTIFVMVYNMGASILRASGDSRRPLYYLIASCACNIVLDLTFVIGLKMGVMGVALATVLSQILSVSLIMVQLCRTEEAYHISLRELRIHRVIMAQMLKIGIPAGLQASMYNFSNLIIQVAVNSLGTVVVAAWTMTSKVDGVYWALSSALGTAVMSFVGQNFGAGKTDRIRRSIRVSMGLFMAFTFVMEGILLLIGRFGLGLLIDDTRVIARTWEIMTYFVPYYFVWTFIEVISGMLRGVGDAIIPVAITGVGICAMRLAWIATVFRKFHTVRGISLCYPISWLITAIAMTIYYARGRWMRLAPVPAERGECAGKA